MTWIASRLGRAPDDVRPIPIMALFFLVVCAVGMLRPIKNSLALDGLGASDFYKVYLVSAVVVLFVPILTRAADHVPWRVLIPGVAAFFATHLLLFRLLYVEGSALFGVAFFGWYDLFAAALVTQFFMATQLFFDARSAKSAYPIVIAGGSIGAALGGAITGFFAESVGTPNLLVIAAGLILVFAVAMPLVWGTGPAPSAARGRESASLERAQLRTIVADRQVRLIAATVLITVLVKQFVDFQFNVLTKEVFETRDAVSAFQGKFNAATQWLPLLVLAGLRPALPRWGVGFAVLLLPAAMLGATLALAITFGLAAAVFSKATETSFRYSAERTGREILYIPVPDEIKLKAKAWIDVAVEKGLGKVLSAVLLGGLLSVTGMRGIAWVTVALSAVWLLLAISVRREYVRTLGRAIEGRFASLRGLFVTLGDASSAPIVRGALTAESPVRVAFALDLLAQAPVEDVQGFTAELHALARHAEPGIRAMALRQLARIPGPIDEAIIRPLVGDADEAVSAAAVRVLLARSADDAVLLRELLASGSPPVRRAALRHLATAPRTLRALGREYLEGHWALAHGTDASARRELALAAATLDGAAAQVRSLDLFLNDPDAQVRSAALGSSARLGRLDLVPRMITALADPAVRIAAREALAGLGDSAVPFLASALLDGRTPERARRAIPAVLSQIPSQRTVEALLRLVPALETNRLLDYRSVKALSRLRARHRELRFDPAAVWRIVTHDLQAAEAYRAALSELNGRRDTRAGALLAVALDEGWCERRECVFRCLGLLNDPHQVYRAFAACTSGSPTQRANALEWLEQRLGYLRFREVAPLLEAKSADRMRSRVAHTADTVVVQAANPGQMRVTDAARLPAGSATAATVASATMPTPAVSHLVTDCDPWIAQLARHHSGKSPASHATMELIEKVLLLQQIDLLQRVRGSHLALLASIARELDVDEGSELIARGEPTTAVYIVTRGEVELTGAGERLRLGQEQAFGTWALLDDDPSPFAAVAVAPTRLLRIHRGDFHDLLADHSELALGLLQGLARRVRTLVA